MEIITYPAIISKTDDKKVPFYVYFPDFDRSTQGKTLKEAFEMAKDLLKCLIDDYRNDGKTLPTASDVRYIEIENEDIVTLIQIAY